MEEIPEEFLDRSYAGVASRNNANTATRGTAFERMHRGVNNYFEKVESSRPAYTSQARPQLKEHIPSENFTASDTASLQEGQKVEHQKFGFGEIIKLEGASHNPIATIKFDLNGEKKIMLNYARLRIVDTRTD